MGSPLYDRSKHTREGRERRRLIRRRVQTEVADAVERLIDREVTCTHEDADLRRLVIEDIVAGLRRRASK